MTNQSSGNNTLPALFFQPKQIKKMWDNWLYYHEGTYYLYYLVTERSPGEGVCLATSTDLVHWHEIGLILPKAEDAQWLGTGAVWKSSSYAQDGKFIMNFSEWRGPAMNEGQQTIFFAESIDLLHWTRLGDEYEFKPDPAWYRINESNASRWDCIYGIPRAGGGYYGYWTGGPKEFPGFGFGETLDGKHWKCLPPPQIEWGEIEPFTYIEIGAVEQIAGQYHLMMCNWRPGGGAYAFVAAAPQGPFRPAKKNFHLMTAQPPLNPYFARFAPMPDGLLISHYMLARDERVYFAPLKRALVDSAGTLRWGWWEGNDRHKQETVAVHPPANHTAPGSMPVMLDTVFDVQQRGLFLEAMVTLPLNPQDRPTGLYIATAPEHGTALLIGVEGVTEVGQISEAGADWQSENRVDRAFAFGKTGKMRLLLKDSLLELYLDDILLLCHPLAAAATGRIGLLGSVHNLAAWHCG